MALSPKEFAYDLFISHASEDKAFVRPLAEELRRNGLTVWYDEFSLKLGDSLTRSITRGLLDSRYGLVILSPSFFQKEWPQSELSGLLSRELGGPSTVILPVWHNVNAQDVRQHSPILADKLAVSSANGLDLVVASILSVVRPMEQTKAQPNSDAGLRFADFSFHNDGSITKPNGDRIPLTALEFRLLSYLISNANRVCTKHEIIRNVWNEDAEWDLEMNLAVLISRVRRKIEPVDEPSYIKTHTGLGYRFVAIPQG